MSESWLFAIRVVWLSICTFGLATTVYGLWESWKDWKAQGYDARVERLYGQRKGRVIQVRGALRSAFIYLMSVLILTVLSAYSIFVPSDSRSVSGMAASTVLITTVTAAIFINSACIQKDRHEIRESIRDTVITNIARYGSPVPATDSEEEKEEGS